MSATDPMLTEALIRELTEWTRQQLSEDLQRGRRLSLRKIVCRLLREGQKTIQSQMPRTREWRPSPSGMEWRPGIPKGTKHTPALSPRRNTSGIVGICPLIEKGINLGWVAYYQKNGVQQRKRFSFSEYGDQALDEARAWREKGRQSKQAARRRAERRK
jgi:hypothetical protein